MPCSSFDGATDEEIRKYHLTLPYYDHEYLMDWYIFGTFDFTDFSAFQVAYRHFVTIPIDTILKECVQEPVQPSDAPLAIAAADPEPESEAEPKDLEPEPEETEPAPELESHLEARLDGVESAVNTWTAHIEKQIKDAKEHTDYTRDSVYVNVAAWMVILFMVIVAFAVCTVPSYRQLDEKVDAKYKLMIANLQILQRQVDHVSEWAMEFKKQQTEENTKIHALLNMVIHRTNNVFATEMQAENALEIACFSCQQLQKLSASLSGDQDPFFDCNVSCSEWENYYLVTEDEITWNTFKQQPEDKDKDEDDETPSLYSYEQFLRKLSQQRSVPGY